MEKIINNIILFLKIQESKKEKNKKITTPLPLTQNDIDSIYKLNSNLLGF